MTGLLKHWQYNWIIALYIFMGIPLTYFFSRFPLRLGPCRVTWKYHMFIIDGCDLILDGIRNNIYFCTRSYQLKKQILWSSQYQTLWEWMTKHFYTQTAPCDHHRLACHPMPNTFTLISVIQLIVNFGT